MVLLGRQSRLPGDWVKTTAVISAVFAGVLLSFAGAVDNARAANATLCDPALLHDIPARSAAAIGGRGFAARVETVSAGEREVAIADELLAGNLPPSLRQLAPIQLTHALPSGRNVRITVCVLPDYLAVGSDRDLLYVPMRLSTALLVGGNFGFTLPTAKIVDAIYAESAAHLVPQPLPASDQMRSTDYYAHHNQLIGDQRRARGLDLGVLISGHKKDLVLTNRLWMYTDRVAIYGWHRGDGSAIQPLSTVHGARYADYSHGVRLVSITVYVDGAPRPLFDVLSDPELAPALSDEGPIRRPNALVATLASMQLDGTLPVAAQ